MIRLFKLGECKMKKLVLVLACFLFMVSGCVSINNNDELNDIVISGNVLITEIAPNEGFPIARVAIGDDSSYIIEVTAEFGSTIFSGLREDFFI